MAKKNNFLSVYNIHIENLKKKTYLNFMDSLKFYYVCVILVSILAV